MCIRKKYYWSGFLGLFLVLLIPAMIVFAPPLGSKYLSVQSPPALSIPSYEETHAALQNPWGIEPVHVGNIDSETLWLARAMFSESKRHDEQELIGWTVRNRVEASWMYFLSGVYTGSVSVQCLFTRAAEAELLYQLVGDFGSSWLAKNVSTGLLCSLC